MTITDVRIRKFDNGSRMKASASVTFDDAFVVHDIKVIESTGGLFVAMPSKRLSDGTYTDIAHPINSGTREQIQKAVLEAFEKQED